MKQVSFKASKADRALVDAIVERAVKIAKRAGRGKVDTLSLRMDLIATHANGCRMDFAKLAGADDFNLAHDVFGIERHIDRGTGKLLNCFVPRCAKQEPARWYKKAHPNWRETWGKSGATA